MSQASHYHGTIAIIIYFKKALTADDKICCRPQLAPTKKANKNTYINNTNLTRSYLFQCL